MRHMSLAALMRLGDREMPGQGKHVITYKKHRAGKYVPFYWADNGHDEGAWVKSRWAATRFPSFEAAEQKRFALAPLNDGFIPRVEMLTR